MKTQAKQSRRGQATAELVLCLFGITLCLIGIVQFSSIGAVTTENALASRGQADGNMHAFASSDVSEYLVDWQDGGDALSYTYDDVAVSSGAGGSDSLALYRRELEASPGLQEIISQGLGMHDDFYPHISSDSLAIAADLRSGRESDTVEIDPSFRAFTGISSSDLPFVDQTFMPGIDLNNAP